MWLTLLGIAIAAFGAAGVAATGGSNAGFTFIVIIAAGIITAITGLFRRAAGRSESNAVQKLYKAYKMILLGLLGIFALTLVVAEAYILAMSGSAAEDELSECRTCIVLGAGLNGDTPSDVYKTRLDAAVELLGKYPEMDAILTGAKGEREEVSEAEAARRYITARGIDESRLTLESSAANTLENMEYSRELFADEKAVIVTSDFHMARSLLCARKAGIEPVAYSAETPWPLTKANFCFREYFGLIKHFLFAND